jgi:hypothetical protein
MCVCTLCVPPPGERPGREAPAAGLPAATGLRKGKKRCFFTNFISYYLLSIICLFCGKILKNRPILDENFFL